MKKSFSPPVRPHVFFSMLLLLVAGLLTAATLRPVTEAPASPMPEDAQGIQWLTWEQAEAKLAKEPRKIFVDVYTDWCGWCKRMDQSTFKDPKVVAYLNKHYYSVKFDAESQRTISLLGQEFEFVASGRRGYNQLANALLEGRLSYPTTVYMTEKLEKIQAIPGYQTSENLLPILAFFGEDAYKTTEYEAFLRDFNAKQ